jgi:transposase
LPYSTDYRQLALRRYEECGSSREVAEELGCSEAWVRRLAQHLRERGTIEPQSTARRTSPRAYDEADDAKIRDLIARKPDATLAEVVEAMGKPVHASTASRTLERLGLPRKKSPRTPQSKTGPT